MICRYLCASVTNERMLPLAIHDPLLSVIVTDRAILFIGVLDLPDGNIPSES